jgi:hypothetical protein
LQSSPRNLGLLDLMLEQKNIEEVWWNKTTCSVNKNKE